MKIARGDILIETGTLLPEPLRLEDGLAADGWSPVANQLDRRQLEKELNAAGWTFFYMAGSIRTLGFGFEKESRIRSALANLIKAVKLQTCNCLEIDDVVAHSFWGMPYVSVSGHSRHIQKGMVFESNV